MEQTLAAAHELFAERGYAAVTMDEIAAAVGVTKPLLYNYFGNKERLYIACMERAGEALIATIAEAVARRPTTPATRSAPASAPSSPSSTPTAPPGRVLFDETLPPGGEVADRVAAYRGRILDLVSASLLAQLPERRREAAKVEVEALSAALLGAAEALARWWLRTEAIPAADAAELLDRHRRAGPARALAPPPSFQLDPKEEALPE